ncbi:hypothetical protein NDA11_003034 [Ustilago hordei]|nr:hypothetical protein NDA11_003034 [Ustilago hordei]
MGRRKSTSQRRLVQTTRIVATVLSKDFGIRNGYEVVDRGHGRQDVFTPTLTRSNEASSALEAFFEQQNNHNLGPHLRKVQCLNSSKPDIKIGDIVEVDSSTSTKTMCLILSRHGAVLHGAIVVTGAQTILHDVLPSDELFLTGSTLTFFASAVVAAIDPKSVSLRYAWDEKRPAFYSLNGWAGQNDTPADQRLVFHEGDFVVLPPSGLEVVNAVVQVQRRRNTFVIVRRLDRKKPDITGFKHDRLLVPREEFERIDLEIFKPIGICHVSLLQGHSSSFAAEPTDFFVAQEDAKLLRPECGLCMLANREDRRKRRDLEPLSAMETMCGAGGLSLGLDLSGACETKFAIDMDEDSIRTFKAHHPSATVFCGDAGDALRRAMLGLRSQEGLRFPCPGEIDMISAGPPCQGFSRKNRHAHREAAEKDSRNLLVCSVLGWVDYLRPKYFVMENVEGFTMSRLGGREQGMVKLVMRCLMKMGYAVTCGYAQSGAFGCPQSRKRFLLLASKDEVTLPNLPQPTHEFLGRPAHTFLWEDGSETTYNSASTLVGATLPAVTASDAISDLPVFDWKDPHVTYLGSDAIEVQRALQGIPQLVVKQGRPTGPEETSYRSQPLNSYQERMRVLAGETACSLTQHQTPGYHALAVERVVNVALYPGANFESWSEPGVKKPALLGTDRYTDEHFRYERVDSDGYFKVLMTKMTTQGSMLHPTQRRLLTVRECARAQGFPDWVHFHTDANLQSAYRQIGNAVPVPLSQAIGKSLTAARMKDHR